MRRGVERGRDMHCVVLNVCMHVCVHLYLHWYPDKSFSLQSIM